MSGALRFAALAGSAGFVLWLSWATPARPLPPSALREEGRAACLARPSDPPASQGEKVVRVHDAPKGWKYPFACCSDFDCREVQKPARVGEGPAGFTVPSGEVLAHGDSRIRHSPDGEFHWCTVAGKEDSRTICLFVPPRGF